MDVSIERMLCAGMNGHWGLGQCPQLKLAFFRLSAESLEEAPTFGQGSSQV